MKTVIGKPILLDPHPTQDVSPRIFAGGDFVDQSPITTVLSKTKEPDFKGFSFSS